MKSPRIRQTFEEYYQGLGFYPLPRAPMLHPSIPMTFVMSAGLVQIETSLARIAERPSDKFVLIQECFRHFDLDKVGSDDIHLSLFEMPGGFMFAPDGRAQTVVRMWHLVTCELGVDASRLWVSYFSGGQLSDNLLQPDEETRAAWINVGMPENRIVGLGIGNNYWVQGGGLASPSSACKCGPNTELFYDRGEERACSQNCRPGCSCGRFIEFANSLFISNVLDSSGCLTRLADPFTETVIGTERVAMILQRALSVFDTDAYRPILEVIRRFAPALHLPDHLVTASERIIADYARALYVLVADGAPPPGKDGRQRIIKLLIRGLVTRQLILGIQSSDWLAALQEPIARTLDDSLPTTLDTRARVLSYFGNEATRFLGTIDRARCQLELLLAQNGGRRLSGTQIVYLEKRFGLPHVLASFILCQKGLDFSEAEYREALGDWLQAPQSRYGMVLAQPRVNEMALTM